MIFWLSFSDNDGFRGGCMIEADNFPSALDQTVALGINPGGEVQSVELENESRHETLGPYELNRLYSLDEMKALGEGAVRF